MKTLRFAAILAATLAATACSGDNPAASAPTDGAVRDASVIGTGAKDPGVPEPGATVLP